jgi:DNA-binding transcriptional ArsR family regulator
MDDLGPDVAGAAALLADRSRVTMLAALGDGQALPAGELARAAGIGAASASAHLARLASAGLVEVIPQGRHRYFRLASARVPELMEALAALAPAPTRPAEPSRVPRELRLARWCYGHLGGRVAVALAQALGTS